MTGSAHVILGDARALPFPDALIDAVVCDPPYGLEFMGREWDKFGRDTGNHRHSEKPRFTSDHMGKGFNNIPNTYEAGRPFQRWCELWAAEVLRVLKPGGHLLAFGGTRTYHRLACAVEDAGFEIRDSIGCLTWAYAQGFPKSLDVSKAIDKRPGVTRHAEFAYDLIGRRRLLGLSSKDVSEAVVGTRSGACWNWEHHQFPEAKWWPKLKETLHFDDKWDAVIAEAERDRIGKGTAGLGGGSNGAAHEGGYRTEYDLTAPATEDAKRWQGWGTALAPAWEPVIVARKPLTSTVAANVLEHGTGAINIDGTRVSADWSTDPTRRGWQGRKAPDNGMWGNGNVRADHSQPHDGGRWPKNLLLVHHPDCAEACVDWCPVAELDQQGGTRTSGLFKGHRTQDKFRNAYGVFAGDPNREVETYGDTGPASRFFPTFRFEPKADTWERPIINGRSHPTVKPVDLMRWLVRLVTPPNGLVLDPFGGSGATVLAAKLEGMHGVGIDSDPDSVAWTQERLSWPVRIDREGRFERIKPQPALEGQGSIFDVDEV